MTKLDVMKIYKRTKAGLVEYKDGSNFAEGERKCPKCEGSMERIPIGHAYIRTPTGKIVVEQCPFKQIMVAIEHTVKSAWVCKDCVHRINPAVKHDISIPVKI